MAKNIFKKVFILFGSIEKLIYLYYMKQQIYIVHLITRYTQTDIKVELMAISREDAKDQAIKLYGRNQFFYATPKI